MYKTIPRLVNHNFCENIFDRLSLINGFILTVGVTVLDEQWKLIWNFIFALLCAASKGFMKALTKAFQCTTKKSEKKIKVNFYLNRPLWNARGGWVNLSSNPKTPETFQKAAKFARKNIWKYSKQNHVNANQLYLCKTFLLWQ